MATNPDIVSKIATTVQAVLPAKWTQWPGGWPDQVEGALLDTVLSIRARYGQPHNGVRGAIRRWRTITGWDRVDDLTVLAAWTPSKLAEVIGNQTVPGGNLKAQAIIEAASRLGDAGVRHARDVQPAAEAQRRAYLGVCGLGPVTWEYFLMLLGHLGVKADTWITRFVRMATGEPCPSNEVRDLVVAAADELGVDPVVLDHAIWDYMRSR